jgi:hypothetical protein
MSDLEETSTDLRVPKTAPASEPRDEDLLAIEKRLVEKYFAERIRAPLLDEFDRKTKAALGK